MLDRSRRRLVSPGSPDRENPAWAAASAEARLVSALYVLDPPLLDSAGPYRRNLLFAHLVALDATLRHHGGRLRVHRGRPEDVVPLVVEQLEPRPFMPMLM